MKKNEKNLRCINLTFLIIWWRLSNVYIHKEKEKEENPKTK